MQNIIEILKGFGFEVPADKTDALNAEVAKNYRTIADYNKQTAKITKAEEERDGYKGQLEAANETLKGFEGVDLATIQNDLKTWQKKYADAEKDFNARLYARDYDDALKAEMENVKFTSEAAKRAVMAEIRDAKLNLKDGKILGLNDLIEQIKTKDASAFVDEQQQSLENNKAKFTSSMNGGTQGKGTMTKADIMKIKDASERQAAIAEHLDLFTQ